MIKVAFDHRLYVNNPNSGMGVYISELTGALRRKKGVSLLFLGYKSQKTFSVVGKVVGLIKEQFWVNILFVKFAHQKHVDIVFFPNPPVSLLIIKPVVLNIPDLSFYFDNSMNLLVKTYLFLIYFLSAKKAALITTFSNSSKRDIMKILKVPEWKIHVIPLGVKKMVFKGNSKKTLKNLNINKKYILSLPGTFVPRKNMGALLGAYNKLSKDIKSKYILVFVGNKEDSYFRDFRKSVEEAGLIESVIFTGYISKNNLAALYKNAAIFVFPSLYEGFGLPPLEAMSAGTPVIVYNRSSLPEVVGDSAILVNNTKELKSSIEKLLADSRLSKRLIKKGRERYKKYSWNRTSTDMINIFKSIANG